MHTYVYTYVYMYGIQPIVCIPTHLIDLTQLLAKVFQQKNYEVITAELFLYKVICLLLTLWRTTDAIIKALPPFDSQDLYGWLIS